MVVIINENFAHDKLIGKHIKIRKITNRPSRSPDSKSSITDERMVKRPRSSFELRNKIKQNVWILWKQYKYSKGDSMDYIAQFRVKNPHQ